MAKDLRYRAINLTLKLLIESHQRDSYRFKLMDEHKKSYIGNALLAAAYAHYEYWQMMRALKPPVLKDWKPLVDYYCAIGFLDIEPERWTGGGGGLPGGALNVHNPL